MPSALSYGSMAKCQVSIIMPHYNDGAYLPDSLNSLLSQTFEDFEVVIVDDGSTDEASLDQLHQYQKLDRRIRVIFNKENRGPALAAWQASEEARGVYIHGIGADDRRYPHFLEESMGQLLNHPELGMCWGFLDWGKEGDQHQERCGLGHLTEPLILQPEETKRRLLHEDLKICTSTAIYRRDLSKKYGHYNPRLSYWSDWFLLNLILLNHPCVFIPKALAFFRVRDKNYSNTARHNKKNKIATYRSMLDWLNQPEHRLYREQFRKTALLTPLFHDMFWKMLFNPRYLHYWPYIAKKYPVGGRIKRSLLKKINAA